MKQQRLLLTEQTAFAIVSTSQQNTAATRQPGAQNPGLSSTGKYGQPQRRSGQSAGANLRKGATGERKGSTAAPNTHDEKRQTRLDYPAIREDLAGVFFSANPLFTRPAPEHRRPLQPGG